LAHYYYTIATLPFLSYDTVSSVTVEDFLSLAKESMTSSAFNMLTAVRLDISDQKVQDLPAFIKPWFRFELSLRNALVKMRAPQLGRESAVYLREGEEDTGLEEIIREVTSQSTPLLAEDVLNRARWRKLDELEVGHYFDLQRMMVLYLKVQLLERKHCFREEPGTAEFEEIYANIREAVSAASSTGNGVS
jgi:hypothetical protein